MPLLSPLDVGVFADLRRAYQERICRDILGYRSGTTIYNVADRSSVASVALAQGMADAIGFPPSASAPQSGQTAGSLFTLATRHFLEAAFARLGHVRPGSWVYVTSPSEAAIAVFDQFDHLAELQEFLRAHRELETALGSDYLVTPDIVIGRNSVDDDEINALEELISGSDAVARLTPLRSANGRRPILHASISCKWTMRSDRAQNTRTEALNLIRNRKGRTPHIAAVTLEPLPSRLASIAMGTGDVDCTYHAALDELLVAVADSDFSDAYDLLQTLVKGRRLRDISDLPLDLAS
jgi:NgoMIV restriction enzyme